MYPNNINIVFYLLVMAVGLFVGNFISWCNFCYLHDRKVFSKEFFKKDLFEVKYTYILMIVIAFLYAGVLYRFGWEKDSNFVFLIFKNLDLFRFYILIPILVLCFLIDLKKRIIPNRLTLTIFEVGLFFTFIYGLNNINVAKDMLLGCLVGGIVFGLITLLGKLIAGKETMGMGDVKLIATTDSDIEAFELITKTLPDVVILDIELHNGSGNANSFNLIENFVSSLFLDIFK